MEGRKDEQKVYGEGSKNENDYKMVSETDDGERERDRRRRQRWMACERHRITLGKIIHDSH